ncbi:MAG TPA: V-type ATP synthase subunit I [Sedimentisphaerales bacterium]|nr:V-type ATP synthase subunit I [Sedimentisphaerales bacterium]
MTKVLIACHRSQAADLLESLQRAGLVEIFDAQQAMVARQWPDLQAEGKRPRDLEEMVARLDQAIAFLKDYYKEKTSVFRPRREVPARRYAEVIGGREALQTLEQVEQTQQRIERLGNERDSLRGQLETLRPWESLDTPVEQLRGLDRTVCLAGLLAQPRWDRTEADLAELGAVVQAVGASDGFQACLVVALRETASDVHKTLRAADFDPVSFEGMHGTVREILAQKGEQLRKVEAALREAQQKAESLAEGSLSLQILYDHQNNVLGREQTRVSVPMTEHTVLLEGWLKRHDYPHLEKIVGRFDGCSVDPVAPAEGEEPPVEIENHKGLQPFEVVTRLYGMPGSQEVDPTPFFAPFFALFFGLCMTDAGYGLIMVALLAFVTVKMRGDKKLLWLLTIGSVLTVIAGALTGGWFGDGIQQFLPGLNGLREAVMWFDPLEDPMKFFVLALALGYFQILFGIAIGFVHALRRRQYVAAVFNYLTWLVMLNSILLYGLSHAGAAPPWVGSVMIWFILAAAVSIFFMSHREGGWGGRLGMGAYTLFSTIFFLGDVLSYLRLMALGMATGGLGMAVNVMTQVTLDIPYIGWLISPLVFLGGHGFNLLVNALGAFVHTLRLQYVEFFPKFLQGGGREFRPLQTASKYVLVTADEPAERVQGR